MAEQTSANNAQNTTETPAQQTPTEAVNSGSSQGAITQDEINKLVGKARTEGKTTGVNDFLKSLGVATADDLKALITEAQTLKQSQMTESEKKQADLDKAAKTIADLQTQLARQTAMIRERDIQGAVKSAVTTLKANDFDAIYLWAEKHHADALNAVINAEGKIDTKALETLLETVKKDKPGYFTPPSGGHAGSQSNANGRVPASDAEALKRASRTNQRIIRGR